MDDVATSRIACGTTPRLPRPVAAALILSGIGTAPALLPLAFATPAPAALAFTPSADAIGLLRALTAAPVLDVLVAAIGVTMFVVVAWLVLAGRAQSRSVLAAKGVAQATLLVAVVAVVGETTSDLAAGVLVASLGLVADGLALGLLCVPVAARANLGAAGRPVGTPLTEAVVVPATGTAGSS